MSILWEAESKVKRNSAELALADAVIVVLNVKCSVLQFIFSKLYVVLNCLGSWLVVSSLCLSSIHWING